MSGIARIAMLSATCMLLAWSYTACGAGGSGTVAQQASQTVSSVADQAGTKLATATAATAASRSSSSTDTTTRTQTKTTTVSRETTVTKPGEGTTVIRTETRTETSQPPTTSTITETTTNASVGPATSTTDNSGGGLSWWGWVLIALGVVGFGIALYSMIHGRHTAHPGPPSGTGSAPAGSPPADDGLQQAPGPSEPPPPGAGSASSGN